MRRKRGGERRGGRKGEGTEERGEGRVEVDSKKLKTLYEQLLHIKSAIPHALIMGVIRGEEEEERGGGKRGRGKGRGEEEGRGEGGRKTRREEVHVSMYNVRGKGNNLVPSPPSSSQGLQ